MKQLPQEGFRCKHLLAQINYKLCEYEKAMALYVQILEENQMPESEDKLEADEVSDIVVNYLACHSSTSQQSSADVEKFISRFHGFEETYEYSFNLSQVYLKDGRTEEALACLRKAYTKAVSDDQFKDDQTRFKVQEMHLLNQLFRQYSDIEYTTSDKDTTWFEFAKTIRNNILVELNINSLSEVYHLNTATFKDTVGSLNWRKFAERINTQLKENQNLTLPQRTSMQINAIISLIKSNSNEEARALLEKTRKQPHLKEDTESQSVFSALSVYFLVKDKKLDEALALT